MMCSRDSIQSVQLLSILVASGGLDIANQTTVALAGRALAEAEYRCRHLKSVRAATPVARAFSGLPC